MKRSLLVLVIFGAAVFSGPAYGQTKTVTNADLEKFRQERLKAEKDYRENYAKWGLPSPEELQRRSEQNSKEKSELAAKLRAEDREQERLEAERERYAMQYDYVRVPDRPVRRYPSPYIYSYPVLYSVPIFSRRHFFRKGFGSSTIRPHFFPPIRQNPAAPVRIRPGH